jgi:hypothetical protein
MTTPYHGHDPHILLRHVRPRLLHQGGNSKVGSNDRVPRGIRSLQSVRHNLLLHRDNLHSSLLKQSPVHSRHRGSSTLSESSMQGATTIAARCPVQTPTLPKCVRVQSRRRWDAEYITFSEPKPCSKTRCRRQTTPKQRHRQPALLCVYRNRRPRKRYGAVPNHHRPVRISVLLARRAPCSRLPPKPTFLLSTGQQARLHRRHRPLRRYFLTVVLRARHRITLAHHAHLFEQLWVELQRQHLQVLYMDTRTDTSIPRRRHRWRNHSENTLAARWCAHIQGRRRNGECEKHTGFSVHGAVFHSRRTRLRFRYYRIANHSCHSLGSAFTCSGSELDMGIRRRYGLFNSVLQYHEGHATHLLPQLSVSCGPAADTTSGGVATGDVDAAVSWYQVWEYVGALVLCGGGVGRQEAVAVVGGRVDVVEQGVS